MSSLQKFHRRTNGGAPAIVKLIGSEAPVSGSGFYLGMAGDGTSYMYVAPGSTTVTNKNWGSDGTTRGTTSTTNGLANTNTLYSFGSAAHPAAYYCKSLSTGGYNTWYLPAIGELNTLWTNHAATPFTTVDGFVGNYYISSTESDATSFWTQNLASGGNAGNFGGKSYSPMYTRAVRRSTI
jgi:hypothetical protein